MPCDFQMGKAAEAAAAAGAGAAAGRYAATVAVQCSATVL